MAKKRKPVRSVASHAKACLTKQLKAAKAKGRTGEASIVDVLEKRFEDAKRAATSFNAAVIDAVDHTEMNFSNGNYATYGNSHRWVPNVTKTMLLVKGRNELTGRQCRVYVRPGRRVTVVEDLN